MRDRVPSDHATVESQRVHLSSIGASSRLQIALPDSITATPEEICSLALDGDQYFTRVSETLTGDPAIRAAYQNRRQTRQGDGTNVFRDWLDTIDVTAGDPLVLDVLETGDVFGLREPGERVVYEPPEPPDDSLASIAESIEYDE